jgi:cytosine/adenosine deaminase-related metal-dependent hydrolase
MTLVLRNARVIDGTAAPTRDGCTIVVEAERLTHVGPLRLGDVIGFSPVEAIACATRNGARLMHMQERIGTLERGKLADLVVVDGDPAKDIAVLQGRSRLSVMKGGPVVHAAVRIAASHE